MATYLIYCLRSMGAMKKLIKEFCTSMRHC